MEGEEKEKMRQGGREIRGEEERRGEESAFSSTMDVSFYFLHLYTDF